MPVSYFTYIIWTVAYLHVLCSESCDARSQQLHKVIKHQDADLVEQKGHDLYEKYRYLLLSNIWATFQEL